MERGIRLIGNGQAPVHMYWEKLCGMIESGEIDPLKMVSHRVSMDELDTVYYKFEKREDGMQKIFVESRVISAGDFDLCWRKTDLAAMPTDVVEPFIQVLNDKGLMPVDKSIKLLSDKSRAAFLPFDRYDVDMDLLRGFPAEVCRRWCVAPFDRMSKSILVATVNPFNQQAAKELSEATSHRLLWYLTTPAELVQTIRKAFR